jgi:cell division septum initiation protein DivIVA
MAEDPEELKRTIEQTRRNVGRDVDALTDKVSPSRVVGRRVERARGGVHRLKEQVMGSAESVSDTAGSAASTVQDAGHKVGDAVGSAPGMARARTRGTPLAAGLIAFAAGWVVAAALPASMQERELAEATKDKAMEAAGPVKEQAAQVAQEVKDHLQEPAQQAVDNVKQSASQAATDVADEGRSAAQQVADGAKDSVDNVREAGSPS